MMKKGKIGSIIIVCLLILISDGSIIVSSQQNEQNQNNSPISTDIDPLVDLILEISVNRIRAISVDIDTMPSFSVKVTTIGETWESETKTGYDVFDVGISQFNIPDDQEYVSVTIEVLINNQIADISKGEKNITIIYDVKTGSWSGDDYLQDESGYGHTSGHEDGIVDGTDCEIWFNMRCNDYDNDGLTYWEEVNTYNTDPMISDIGKDDDNDTIPIEWEDHWGYDPFSYDNHATLDPDNDGIQNIEEYELSRWFADPFRQDIYIENDYMESNGRYTPIMPEQSIQLQYSSFTKYNIMLLIDDGLMGGSDIIPYKEMTWDDYEAFYENYFLHNDQNNPRQGAFHYALIIHDASSIFGRGVGGFNFERDAFAVASTYIQKWRPWEQGSIIGHGGSYMHELGHQLGLDHLRVFPWQPFYWLSGNFKSCMNYRYNFKIVDYSDGTHGFGFIDHDEWNNLNLPRFQR